MKPSHFKVTLFSLLFSFIFTYSTAQTQQYYVVVGAFAKESNAKKFSGFVRSRFFQATYELNENRNLFYVYVIKTANKKEAFDQVRILQKEEAFKDAWVFRGNLGSTIIPVEETKPEPVEVTPEVVPIDTTTTKEIVPVVVPVIEEQKPVVEPVKEPEMVVKGKLFKFVIKTPSGEAIAGNVHHVDLLKGRDLATYKGNDYSDVPKPVEQKEPMTLVCGLFGYKEVTQLIDYNDPSITQGAVQDEKGAWTIPFVLERLKKGDVSVMYDVSFYKDAVIMLPRSQEELDELVTMMESNSGYKIKVHGHCNGNNKRKIIALGKTRNYFDMKGSDQQNGSAKELSKQRAEAVRDYLVEHGIDKSRMEIMAWGGLNMMVGETSASAKLNDRIEIEILED
jgi:outer membrane protein OmpA-like peptidoglycan-associated protein